MEIRLACGEDKQKITRYDNHINPDRIEECIRNQFVYVLENEQGYHGFHIVLRLPVEGNVSTEEYRTTYINECMIEMQDQWIKENPIVTNENFDAVNPADIYTALTTLRDAIAEEATAAAESESASASEASSVNG